MFLECKKIYTSDEEEGRVRGENGGKSGGESREETVERESGEGEWGGSKTLD